MRTVIRCLTLLQLGTALGGFFYFLVIIIATWYLSKRYHDVNGNALALQAVPQTEDV